MILETCMMVMLMTSVAHTQSENVETTIIDTQQGPINGLKTVNLQTGKDVFEFRGIPYAKALRFKKPEPVEKWTDTLDATEFGAACPQFVFEMAKDMGPPMMSEDCLFLNIYVPSKLTRNEKLPVMVWIHGGGLQMGYSNQYDGGWIATEGNVIVVTINYRLNIFGFLGLDNPALRGNYGLWDQKMAFQWVQENIGSFGGDSQSVTIFGQSGGAWSTSFQSLIPSNKGLFNRVIAQSGVAAPTTFSSKEMIKDTISYLANETACPTDDMEKFVDCLREKSMEELIKATDFMKDIPNDKILFMSKFQPVIDGDLFPENPLRRLEDKNSEEYTFFNSLDFMVGTSSNEGVMLHMSLMPQLQEYYGFNVTEGVSSKFVRQGMIDPFVETFYNNDSDVKTKLHDFYERESQTEQGLLASHLMSDIWFSFATVKMLGFHQSGKGKTFQYVFSKASEQALFGQPPEWCKGVGHGEELWYMFDMGKIMPAFKGVKLSNEDKAFSKRIIQYWSSFAKTGQPDAGDDSVSWKQYDTSERAYLDINVKDTVKTNWKQKMYEVWSTFSPAQSYPDKAQRDEL